MSSMPAWSRPGNPEISARFHRTGAWLAALAVMAACLGGLGTAYWFGNTSQGVPVLVVARTVLQGEIIQTADLAVAEVVAPGVPLIAAADRDSVVDRRALTTLVAGSLLAPDSFGQPILDEGLVQVRLQLGPGQLPNTLLPGGQALTLFGLPGSDEPNQPALQLGARVVYPPSLQLDGTVVLDVAILAVQLGDLAPYVLQRRVVVVLG